jgi:hypothetical protein
VKLENNKGGVGYLTMEILTQISLQILGFTLLSLSLPRHYYQVINSVKRPSKPIIWTMRLSGYTILLLAVIYAFKNWGVILGFVYFFATTTLVATFLTILWTYKPHYLAFILIRLKS